MQNLNITLIQPDLRWQDPAANRAMLERMIRETADDSDVVILPEMFTTGFTMEAKSWAESPSGATTDWMTALAAECRIALCGSLIIEAAERFYNRLLWVTPEGESDFYDKRHLFRMASEHEHFSAGTHRSIMTIDNWRICPLICYDLRFPVWSRGSNEYDLLIYVANWPASRRSAWQVLLPARAVENQCYVAGVNRVGEDGNGVAYSGDSVVVDYLGRALAACGDEAESATVSLDLDALDAYREKFPAWKDGDEFDIRG